MCVDKAHWGARLCKRESRASGFGYNVCRVIADLDRHKSNDSQERPAHGLLAQLVSASGS